LRIVWHIEAKNHLKQLRWAKYAGCNKSNKGERAHVGVKPNVYQVFLTHFIALFINSGLPNTKPISMCMRLETSCQSTLDVL